VDLVSEHCKSSNATKRTADELQCGQRLCVLPSGVTAMGQTNYIILLIFWVGTGRRRRDMDVLLGELTTEWVCVCGQGEEPCVIYLTSANTSHEELGEMCLQFEVINMVRFYGVNRDL